MTAGRERLRGEPRSIQQLAAAELMLPEAAAGDEDPTRRRLRERALDAGVRLEPDRRGRVAGRGARPRGPGVGDTVASVALIADLGLADRVAWVSLDPPLHERFALITRRGAPSSPAMQALVAIIESQLMLETEPARHRLSLWPPSCIGSGRGPARCASLLHDRSALRHRRRRLRARRHGGAPASPASVRLLRAIRPRGRALAHGLRVAAPDHVPRPLGLRRLSDAGELPGLPEPRPDARVPGGLRRRDGRARAA